jgi:hypothetical protein
VSARATAAPRAAAAAGPRRRPARSASSGRVASLPNGLVVAVVGALLCCIVALQVGALRANMEAGDVRREVRAVETASANLLAEIERKRADGRIERAAARYGMIRPPIDAVRTLRMPKAEAAK